MLDAETDLVYVQMAGLDNEHVTDEFYGGGCWARNAQENSWAPFISARAK